MYRRYWSSTGGRIVSRRLQCLLVNDGGLSMSQTESSLVLPLDQFEHVQIQSKPLMVERSSSPRLLMNLTNSSTQNKFGPSRSITGGLVTPNTHVESSPDADKSNENYLAAIADEISTFSPRRGIDRGSLNRMLTRCVGTSVNNLKIVVAMGHWSPVVGSHEANGAVVRSLIQNGIDDIYCLPASTGGRGWLNSFRTVFFDDTSTEIVNLDIRHPLSPNIMLCVQVLVAKQSKAAAIEGRQILGSHLLDGGQSSTAGNSYGLGQTIREIAEMGINTIYVGLSADTACLDCGVGMAQALGIEFFDAQGQVLPASTNICGRIAAVDVRNLDPVVRDCRIIIGYESPVRINGHNNVINSCIQDPALQEEWMRYVNNLTSIMGLACNNQVAATLEGSGTCGGCAYMISVLLPSELQPGVHALLKCGEWARRIAEADLLLTGAREVNPSSNELPVELCKMALTHDTRAIVYTGQTAPAQVQAPDVGIDCIVPLPQGYELCTDRDIIEMLMSQVTRSVKLLRMGHNL